MKLNSGELKSAIIGMVIGDGCLTKRYKNSNAFIQMTHSANQYDYMIWKKKIIDKITSSKIYRNDGTGQFGDKVYEMYHLSSKVHPLFTKLYKRFYHQNHKCLDEYLVKKITPLALAIIAMDDGTVGRYEGKNDSFFLCLQSFDYANQLLFKKSMKIKFDLNWAINKANITKSGTRLYRLRLAGKDRDKFVNIIRPYIDQVPCMSYKFNFIR